MYYTVIKLYGILKHEGNVENTSRRRVFSTFLESSQMSGVFYHSVKHGSGCFIAKILRPQNNKHAFSKFYTLIKHRFLTNQSACRVLSLL